VSHPPLKSEVYDQLRPLLEQALRLLVEAEGVKQMLGGVAPYPVIQWWVFQTPHGNVTCKVEAEITLHDPAYREKPMLDLSQHTPTPEEWTALTTRAKQVFVYRRRNEGQSLHAIARDLSISLSWASKLFRAEVKRLALEEQLAKYGG